MLIGIHGRAWAGKNLLAEMFNSHALGFADPLYEAISVMFGIPESRLRDRSRKEEVIPWVGKSPRELLQTLGTEWGRGLVRADIWLRVAEQRLGRALDAGFSRVAFADLRFDNEAEWIRERGGVVVWITRPGGAACREHVSEAGIGPHLVDFTVHNDGTVDDLRRTAIATLEEIQGHHRCQTLSRRTSTPPSRSSSAPA